MNRVDALLHPHLHLLRRRARAVRGSAEQLTSGLTDEQLAWRPEPGRWGIAHCLSHLTRTGVAYRRFLEPALAEAPRDGGDAFRPRLIGRLLLWTVDPANRRRFPAPRGFRPDPEVGSGSVHRFMEEQDRLLHLILAANGRDLNRGRFRSPISPLIRLSVGEGLTLLTLHGERHLRQAWEVRMVPEFPVDVA